MPIEKLAKSQKNRFLGKTFFGNTIYKGQTYIFEISMKRRIVWCILFELITEKKFSSHREVSVYFFMNSKVQNASNHSIFHIMFFYKQFLDFHRPSNILCVKKINGPYFTVSHLIWLNVQYIYFLYESLDLYSWVFVVVLVRVVGKGEEKASDGIADMLVGGGE